MLRDAGARLTARVTSALSAASQEVDKETTPTQAPPVDPALKGISQDLLDKVSIVCSLWKWFLFELLFWLIILTIFRLSEYPLCFLPTYAKNMSKIFST